ncbi:hypothetical protein E8E13_004036 [Curvularia kusanoi]|uniref:Rhodopsin domain-containing protein n=1 Tax=Curvularia kusanoi TaxID=90978 RepID=A0A9P4T9S3_CURKU|nr:hypothetical protein E8E13_004036 [Curvularia kusanoi]
MFLDIVVLLLPLPFLGMLRLAGKSRVGLITLFAMGGVVAIVSIGRLISLCIKRAGTVPVPDMTYYTPVVYIFSVLEVNIAILVASIPIFWPMISSFATNKILVVNEIVVHVEQYPKTSLDGQDGIGLAEQAAFKSPPESPSPTPQPPPSCLSNITRKFDRRPSQDANALSKHRSKSSVASSIGKTLSRSDGHARVSEESQRHLYKAPSHETVALGQSDYDWFAELDKKKRISLRTEQGSRAFDTRRPSGK